MSIPVSEMERSLPPASFVPFAARRLARPVVAWRNAAPGMELDLHQFAYCAPLEGDPIDAYASENKVFFGERYGGRGLGNNGGGVRCGVAGDVQIKGIGANLLRGADPTDYFHSYGGATLEEGIRDALWGEVCHHVLPYGAARVYGLIVTGTSVPVKYPAPGAAVVTPRALLVRQAAVRPAHYMRAVFYRQPAAAGLPTDAQRTRDAVRQIGHGFQSAFGAGTQADDDSISVNTALQTMFRRYAAQIAAARAKRIMHGALTESNICLDGRWIDFGRISTLSDYGRIIIGKNMPDFLYEHVSLLPIARELVFYLKKYHPLRQAEDIIAPEALVQLFQRHLHHRSVIEFGKLTGIPEHRLLSMEKGLLQAAYRCFRKIIAHGNAAPFVLTSTGTDCFRLEMPAQMTTYHLSTLLRTIAVAVDTAEADSLLLPLIAHQALRTELITCCWALRQAYLRQFPAEIQAHATAYLMANAVRLNTEVPELYHMVLNPRLIQLVDSGEAVTPWLDGLIAKAVGMLADSTGAGLDIQWLFGTPAVASEQYGVTLGDVVVSIDEVRELIRKLI